MTNYFFEKPKRRRLTDAELEQRLGRERLNELTLARFGGVMISDDVFSGSQIADYMVHKKPEEPGYPSSGWIFFSSESGDNAAAGVKLHDCLAIFHS